MDRSRYIAIPADRLVSLLDRIGESVIRPVEPPRVPGRSWWGRSGAERTFTLALPGHPEWRPAVKVLTTLDGGETVRDCGADAVRIIVGVVFERGVDITAGPLTGSDRPAQFYPVEEPIRLLRTAPRGVEEARVTAWLGRFTIAMRDAYQRARKLPRCPTCGRVMTERSGRSGPFLGCRGYPVCTTTRPIARRA